jgi:long-chain acyl-CoA synthetase
MPNFAARISEVAARMPAQPAIEQLHADGRVETTTYADLVGLAGRVAAWLLHFGIRGGDRVAILADNDARWIAAYLGILRIGAIAVPLDTAYKAPQVGTVLENSGARLLFTTARYLDTARGGAAAVPAGAPGLALLNGEAAGAPDARAFDEPRAVPPMADVPAAATAVLLYTSGTTADPKGVVLTHGNLDAEREAAFDVVTLSEQDALLGVLPLFHALAQMANLLLPLTKGARVVFLDTVSSSSLVAALGSRGITIFVCVPQFFYLIHQRVMAEVNRKGALARRVLRGLLAANTWLRDHAGVNPGRRLFGRIHRSVGPRMRFFVTGGSKFDPAIRRDLYGLGFTILNAYGLTETSGGATINRLTDGYNDSVGHPLKGVEVRIQKPDASAPGAADTDADADGKDDGEVLIRGPIVMREYFNRPDATREALEDGWLHTGDLGRLDAQGRVYITGRKKEIIVLSSGKNLYPEEIEAHYRQSVFIKELCILGLSRPGEPSAERLHAIVVPDEDVMRAKGIVNVKELVRFEIEGRSVGLPAHKRILSYDISMEPLPRTTTGKIRRHEIQRRLRDRVATTADESRPVSDADAAWAAEPSHAEALEIIARRLDRAAVRPDANLELDLGLDSMERVELLTLLEQRQGTRVAPDVRATLFSVKQLVTAVETAPRVEGRADAVAAADPGAELPWEALLAKPADPAVVAALAKPSPIRAAVLFAVVQVLAFLTRPFIRFRHSGVERLPARGPYILSPNHQAYVDPFLLAAALPYRAFRDLFFVGAAEYFETPLSRWFARMVNLIPVDPDANLVAAMQAGAAGLRLGKILVLFPEGERSIDGELKKFRKGAPILSAHLDAPIVPVALDGLYALWARGRSLNWRLLKPWRRAAVTYEFGEPLQAKKGAYAEGTDALKAAVAKMFERIRGEGRRSEVKGQR